MPLYLLLDRGIHASFELVMEFTRLESLSRQMID